MFLGASIVRASDLGHRVVAMPSKFISGAATRWGWLTVLVLVLVLVSIAGCKSDGAEPAGATEPAGTAYARAMTQAFAAELQATLLAAIEAGGPAHAIEVCKHDAPRISAEQGAEGWTLSRTATRVRNPQNAPNSWQQAVLEDWQTQLASGRVADPATLEWTELVSGPQPELRYMRAIPLGGVCLACHGPDQELDPAVLTALAEHYPEDQATGFRVGELRGAFVVTGPAARPPAPAGR